MDQDSQKLIRVRLSRIEGQVRGLMHMVEEDRESVDILTQLAALRAALDAVGSIVISQHVDCLALESDLSPQTVSSLKLLIERFLK